MRSIDLGEFLKELTFWHSKTDQECINMATGEFGVDAEQALKNIFYRDFCKATSDRLIEILHESTEVNDDKNSEK